MFNSSLRKSAQKTLMASVDEQKEVADSLQTQMTKLFEVRKELQREITQTLALINKFKNTPEHLELKVKKIDIKLNRYQNQLDIAEAEYKKAIAGGVATGIGLATTMAVATTFGTTSMSTIITTLSGAVVDNTAVAWLGGGALAVGGAGVGGSEVLLALAGPIGWGIAGAAVIGGGILANGKNKKAAEHMYHQASEIDAVIKTQKAMKIEIDKMIDITQNGSQDLDKRRTMAKRYPTDFRKWNQEQISLMGVLVNNMHSATINLNQTLGEDGQFHEIEGYSHTVSTAVDRTRKSLIGRVEEFGDTNGSIKAENGQLYPFKRFSVFDDIEISSTVRFIGYDGKAKDIYLSDVKMDSDQDTSLIATTDSSNIAQFDHSKKSLIGTVEHMNDISGSINGSDGQTYEFKNFNVYDDIEVGSTVRFIGYDGEAKAIYLSDVEMNSDQDTSLATTTNSLSIAQPSRSKKPLTGIVERMKATSGSINGSDGQTYEFKSFNAFDDIKVGSTVRFIGYNSEAKDIYSSDVEMNSDQDTSLATTTNSPGIAQFDRTRKSLTGRVEKFSDTNGSIKAKNGQTYEFKRFSVFDDIKVGSTVRFIGYDGKAKDIYSLN